MAERGAERIAEAFAGARAEGRAALMPFMMGAYPDRAGAIAVAGAYADAGADIIEVGVPYADPLADGPVIHDAATHALRGGARLADSLAAAETIADRVPVVLMAYANMVLAAQTDLIADAAQAGVSGLIVPDLPLDDAAELRAACAENDLALVPLVAPNTTAERRSRICGLAEGFVYVVSLTGVTGERDAIAKGLAELVESVRADAQVPAAVGFGVSTAEQAAEVGAFADGVIIGSRLVREIELGAPIEDSLERISALLRDALAAMSAATRA